MAKTPAQTRRPIVNARLLAWTALCAPAACVAPDRRPAAYVGAGMAGRNNPRNTTGDEDNLTAGGGVKLPLGGSPLTVRADVQTGDLTTLLALGVSHDFRLAGDGQPGTIDAHVGAGVTALSERANTVLGNRSTWFLRTGVEGYLVHGVIGGACLLVAPWGYDHDDLALAGLVYAGVRF